MREQQEHIIDALHVRPNIDPSAEIRERVAFMRDYLEATGARGFVLGISGGQDSSLLGRLAQLAVESARADGREAVFVAVRLPHGVQQDEADAQLALDFIQPDERVTFNIQQATTGIADEFALELPDPISDFNKGNVKARIRMVAQYAIAGERGLLVLGTDHAAEAVTGFFTKYGDGAVDLTPLAGLTKGQGRALLQELGAPERLYVKAPTADLLDGQPGQTDEENLGLRYTDIDAYLEGRDVEVEAAERIERLFHLTRHKRAVPVAPYDSWWRDDVTE
ncbi:ammonia-dependent NAD(+) synthetase [Pseudoclavibacter chungangensis]|uniref:NH(3)-dependent NAD(+) synthetase n=1 Tax=Pseudoclavibacter chungangensis TaxID=587635 RepID=A0A7J5BTQ3_9MICO|nr:ammonia-dependent NAD(+) synthetase [Pseudoclavibacter chungangensis]KAB1656866.1 ammonia-dependent NAD(+) synthetase [Pseudoclavibacter chungangensis]NYJ67333.1 NAD+ synthase [Pseudoclavibacter chungangensis]